MRPLVLTAGSVFLTSCVLGPNPESPTTSIPASIRGDSSRQGGSFGDQAWRKVFTDPTLRSLIERALANNPDLVAATYRIEQARAQAAAARADWFPRVDGSAGGTANYLSPNAGQVARGGDRSVESYDVTGLLSWELDLWGGIRRSNEAARARLLQAEYQRDAVRTSLIAAVASAYISLKNLDERLEISERTMKSREDSLAIVTTRRDGEVSSDLEVNQSEALYREATTAIPITKQAIAAKENELRTLIGEYPGSIARGGNLDRLESSLRIKAGLPSALMQRRPDIAAADAAYQAALADIGVAESLRLPSLSLTGSGGVISGDLNNLLEGRSGAYSIGPRLAGPIFDAGRSKARVDAAKAAAGEAEALHKKAAQQAFREAADALDAYAQTGEIVAQLRQLVNANTEVARLANMRFIGGESGYLEVLDAERNQFSSELTLADARRDRQLAVVEAYRALGGGWK